MMWYMMLCTLYAPRHEVGEWSVVDMCRVMCLGPTWDGVHRVHLLGSCHVIAWCSDVMLVWCVVWYSEKENKEISVI
jgi:hypothetical protein